MAAANLGVTMMQPHRLSGVAGMVAQTPSERENVALQYANVDRRRAAYTAFTPIATLPTVKPFNEPHLVLADHTDATDVVGVPARWTRHNADNLCCFLDGEPFDGVPIYAPVRVRRAPYAIYVGGPPYCSWACAERDIISRYDVHHRHQLIEALRLIRRRYFGERSPYTPAPPRQALKKYNPRGMTIEQFRAASSLPVTSDVRRVPAVPYDEHAEQRKRKAQPPPPPVVRHASECIETVDHAANKRVRLQDAATTKPQHQQPPLPSNVITPRANRRTAASAAAPSSSSSSATLPPPPPVTAAVSLHQLSGAAGASALGYTTAYKTQQLRRIMGIKAAPPPPAKSS